MATSERPRPAGRRVTAGIGGPGPRGGVVRRLAALLVTGSVALGLAAGPVVAADPLTITVSYPAVVVAPGSHVSFNASISTPNPARVDLSLTGAPTAWKPAIHGGTYVVTAVETSGTDASTGAQTPTSIRVDLDVPSDATGTTSMTLTGSVGAATVTVPLSVKVEADVTGQVTLTTDFPSLQGPSSQTFNFNLTLQNSTAEDQTFSVNAQGPTGWTITATLTGQSQAASAVVKAGSSSGVTVSAVPPTGVEAGSYPISVVATAAGQNYSGDLTVNITGSYNLAISTSDGVLNGHGAAGSASPMSVTVTNSGTAAVTNVKLTSTAPSGWDVTFNPSTIDSVAAGQTVTVDTTVKPAGDAIAGDYNLTFTASGDQSTRDSATIRYTVETSILWGVIGVALIVVVAAGVWWVFQRYGRR